MENYLIAMAVFACLYALLALGLNLVWGMAGMINLGLVGFFGVGAYVSALATKRGGAPIVVGLAAALALTALAGVAMAMVTARLRGDYLAIITLGFSEVVRLIASNEIWLTNGTDGISGIPGPWRGRVTPATFNVIFLLIALLAVGAVLLVLQRVRHSPYGRVLRAIRDDDQVAAVAGKHVIRFKVEAFAVSAGILGLAGALWGHYTSYIAPEVFVPLLTIYVVLALTAGGTGNNWGAIVGAFLVVFFLEATRFATGWLPGLKPVQVAAVRELLIGASLLVVLRLRPAGLLPERIPREATP
ncbi:MAG TPA: branched-chain amino acid ABC transporter permease [Candidatus Acidoferrum sp.]|jgi:branched-chain amino acid transport system permease protein|nr:branched-chain amino acid ABC transporter permease [Candidatus Acidoferrum sp.]